MIARLLLTVLLAMPLLVAQILRANEAVINAATLASGPFAPGTLVIATGSGLSDVTAAAPGGGTQPLPTSLGGVQVFLWGMALPLVSVSPEQVQFQLPYSLDGVSSGTIYVQTRHADGHITESRGLDVEIVPAAPGIFAFGGAEPRAGLVVHAQSTANAQAGSPVTAATPARPGETLIIWATGLGNVMTKNPGAAPKTGIPMASPDAPVSNYVEANVDGRSVPVVSAVLPQGAVGVYEVRVQVPDEMNSDAKAQLTIMQNGYTSNVVVLPIQGASR